MSRPCDTSGLKTVILLGKLGTKFGRKHRFSIRTPAEAIRALCANSQEFRRELINSKEQNVGYRVIVGSEAIEELKDIHTPSGRNVIKIVPTIMGSGAVGKIILGAVLIGAAVLLSPFTAGSSLSFIPSVLGSIGATMALGGVSQLLSPSPKTPGPSESADNQPNYLFDGPVNTTAQGQPVAIGYGRMIVGSAVVSAGLDADT